MIDTNSHPQLNSSSLIKCVSQAIVITGEVPVETEDRYEDFDNTDICIIGVFIPESKDRIILVRAGGSSWLNDTFKISGVSKWRDIEKPFETTVLGESEAHIRANYSRSSWQITSLENLGFKGTFIC